MEMTLSRRVSPSRVQCLQLKVEPSVWKSSEQWWACVLLTTVCVCVVLRKRKCASVERFVRRPRWDLCAPAPHRPLPHSET